MSACKFGPEETQGFFIGDKFCLTHYNWVPAHLDECHTFKANSGQPNCRSEFPVEENPVQDSGQRLAGRLVEDSQRMIRTHDAEWNGMGYNTPESNRNAAEENNRPVVDQGDLEYTAPLTEPPIESTTDQYLVELTRIADALEQIAKNTKKPVNGMTGIWKW